MASPARSLSFLFLLLLISSLQIHARDSKFFSKVTRDNNSSINDNSNNNNAAAKETEEVSYTQKEEEPSFTPQNSNGFGLYGHASEKVSPNSVNFPEKAQTQQYTHENYEQQSFYTGYPTNNYRSGTKQQGMTSENEVQQQGMSDTRFLENGKYYYNTNKEDQNGYASYKGFESSKGRSGYNSVPSPPSYENTNEFSNSYGTGGYKSFKNTNEFTNSLGKEELTGGYNAGYNGGYRKTDDQFTNSLGKEEFIGGYNAGYNGGYRKTDDQFTNYKRNGGYNGVNKNTFGFQNQDEFQQNQEEFIP